MKDVHSTVEVTEETFESIVNKPGIVFLDFWAEWCGPCRAFAPIYEAVASRHKDVVFGKVDTEAERGLAAAFGIRAIPTLMVLRDGVLLAEQPGMLPEAALEQILGRVRDLDMDEVRASVAAQQAEAEKAQARG